jgi:UDP-2,3-diacylglucosamine hydrolase
MSQQLTLIAPVFFISDVHLGVGSAEDEQVKQQRFVALCDQVFRESGSLCIIGDLFDFWYEYRSVVPRGFHRILAAMHRLTNNGQSVLYFAGNHDFAIGDFFSRDLGVVVIHDDQYAVCDDRRFYLFHGDGLAAKDGGYRMLKKILRARWSQWLFRLLHPDLSFGFAHRFSHSSRDYTSSKFYGETDGMRLEASRRINDGADFVIMGHRHQPAFEHIDSGVYVNLGDWITHFSYAVFENGELTLRTMRNDFPEPLCVTK